MNFIFLKIIGFYQKYIAKLLSRFLEYFGLMRNNSCVFYPTCSEYTKQAIQKYGILKGFFLGFVRILRCHPWQKNHMDPLK
ncbi:MAG: membrane protein insertion efficiency factor YidD [Burkholderiales bacterium]|nr:membrane protein insertion efficiency factor YidD [Burkholderiales bacterium]